MIRSGCRGLKTKESNLLKYGVDNPMKIKEISKKNSESSKISYNTVRYEIESEGYKLLTKKDEYENCYTPLELLCSLGHETTSKFSYWRSGSRCNKCAIIRNAEKSKLDGKFVWEKYRENGLIPLFDPNEYVNAQIPMPCYCPIHSDFIQYKRYSEIYSNHGCGKCRYIKSSKTKTLDEIFVFNEFLKIGLVVLPNEKYINNRTKIKCKCLKHDEIFEIEYSSIQQGHGCPRCGYDRYSGENHYLWKSGITPISNYLRGQITGWKKKSMEACNYKCVITNERFDVIHHLHSFNSICIEVFKELNLEVKNIVSDYTEDELNLITEKVISLHDKYPLGVCLVDKVHKLFHNLYGTGGNTPEQFIDFQVRWSKGEFENLF
jgi:hypothetical protein